MVFKYAVEKVNSRRDILPYTKLTYDIQESPADDSFLAAKKGEYSKNYSLKTCSVLFGVTF